MSKSKRRLASAAMAAVLVSGLVACKKAPDGAGAAPVATGKLDQARLLAVDGEPGAWLTSGRDFG